MTGLFWKLSVNQRLWEKRSMKVRLFCIFLLRVEHDSGASRACCQKSALWKIVSFLLRFSQMSDMSMVLQPIIQVTRTFLNYWGIKLSRLIMFNFFTQPWSNETNSKWNDVPIFCTLSDLVSVFDVSNRQFNGML